MCRSVVHDFVTAVGNDDEPDAFLALGSSLDQAAKHIADPALADALLQGIAIAHDGQRAAERRLVLDLFAAGSIRVLVIPREAIWTLPTETLRAKLVVVMSAQSVLVDATTGERELSDYPIADVLRIQSFARDGGALRIMCQAEQADMYARDLTGGIAVESHLGDAATSSALVDLVFDDLTAGRIGSLQDVVDLLSWTYLARRARSLVADADGVVVPSADEDVLSRVVDRVVERLRRLCCVLSDRVGGLKLTSIGRMLARRGWRPSVLEPVFATALDDALAVLRRSPPREGAPTAPDVNAGQLEGFRLRLPRAIKNELGLEDADLASDEATAVERYERVLVGTFLFRRIPPGEEIAAFQALFVERIVDGLRAGH